MYKYILLVFLIPTFLFSKVEYREDKLNNLLAIIPYMSNTIHSLQEERCASTGYVNSNGKKFAQKLNIFKEQSDYQKEKLFTHIRRHSKILDSYFSKTELERVTKMFDDLDLLRKNVKILNTTFSKTYLKYTQIIAYLLLNMSDMSDKIENKKLKDTLYTYATFLMYEDSIGQKRAVLGELFSKKTFSKAIYEYFLIADTEEKIYLKTFLHHFNENMKIVYYQTLDTSVVNKVKEYEEIALEKFKDNNVNVNPEVCFANITKKIDLVKEIEYKIFDDIITIKNVSSILKKDNRKLNIAFNFDKPPFMFGETSSKGIESDLVKEILESRGYKVKISQMSKAYLDNILYEESDVDGVSSITLQDDNLFYSDNFVSFVNYAITRKKDNIKIDSINDLSKIKFVSWKGAYNDLGKKFYKLFNPKDGTAKQSYSDSSSQADDVRRFFDKKTDAIIIDKTIFKWYKLKYKNLEKYEFHKIFPKVSSYPIAFKSKKVRDEFNKGLQELKKSGRYDEIIQFYTQEDIEPLLKFANLIANISGKFMFDGKQQELKHILKEFFQHPDITDIEIFNKIKNQNYLILYKKDGKVLSAKNEKDNEYIPSITKNIYFSNKGTPLFVGKLIIHYKKSFTNNKAVLIPELSNFAYLEDEDKKKIEQSYKKFDFNIKTLKLTKDEKEWLKLHKVVRFTGDPAWLPFEAFNEKGKYIGIVSEYLNKLESLIGIRFKRIATKSWSNSVKLSESKSVDVLSETTDSNRKNLIFSKPYITNDIVIVMNKEHRYVKGLNAIKDKKIALINDYGYIKKIQKKYPNINFTMVNTVRDGLTAVSIGKIDALICTFALASYTTTIMGISNIKIVGKTQFTTSLGLGVRDDYAPFVNILNKAIDLISLKEHNEIFNHWIKQDYVEKVDYTLLYKVGGSAFVLLLLFIFWNRKMAREIKKRKIIELKMKKTQKALEDSKIELDEERNFVSSIISSSQDALIVIDKQSIVSTWNDSATQLFGYEREEIVGESVEKIIPKKYKELHKKGLQRVVSGGENRLIGKGVIEIEGLHKNGTIIDIDLALNSFIINNEIFFSANIRDIRERKELTEKIKKEKEFTQILLDSQEQLIITTDGEKLITANETFFEFFTVNSVEDFRVTYNAKCICDKFNLNVPDGYLQTQMDGEKWIDYVISHSSAEIHKVMITMGKNNFIFSVTATKLPGNKGLKSAVFTDITELEKAKLNIENIADTITDLIFYKDLDLKYVGANKAFCAFIGLSKEELIGRTDFDLFTQEVASIINDVDKKLLQTSKSIYFEEDVPNAQGEMRNLITQKHVLRDNSGRVYGIVGSVTDITKLKQLEIKMKDSQQQLELAYDTANLGLWDWYVKENKILTNDNCSTMLGYKANTFPDTVEKWSNLIHPDDKDKIYKLIEQHMRGKTEIYHNSNRLMGAHGEWIWVDAFGKVSQRDKDGNPIRFTGIHINIDKSKRLSTALEKSKREIEAIHKHTKESIEYASLIQSALIPDKKLFKNYFQEYFMIWKPKDIVGGDIYLFEELRDKDECLLMVIDCTGHGVAGAFVTMLVKAIERQIVAKINADRDKSIDVSPAWILTYFNKNMKKLLKQESKDSISNAGFDGGVIYYNKKEKIIKFAGAETPLFYVENGELKIIRGDRHSIGYKKSDINYVFKDTIIDVHDNMQFYLTTDGYLDQNGGEKDFPFGKKRFKNIINEYYKLDMEVQKEYFLSKLNDYQGNAETNDDMTLLGFTL